MIKFFVGKGKNALVGMVILLLTIAAVIILSEIFVRFAIPQFQVSTGGPVHRLSPVLGYEPVPNYRGTVTFHEFGTIQIQTNSEGMRDHREYERKGENVFRILGLGDSFTWGAGVNYDDTYLRVLERMLNSESSPYHYEVVKAGVSSYDTRKELIYLKENGLKYDPDLILVGFLANDILSNAEPVNISRYERMKRRREVMVVGEEPPGGFVPFPRDLKTYLNKKSHLYTVLARGFNALMHRMLRVEYAGVPREYLRDYPKAYEEAWEETKKIFREMNKIALEKKARLVILHIPQVLEVYGDRYNYDGTRYDWGKVANLLSEFARLENIPLVELTPRLKEAGATEELYYPIDGHLNKKGYRMVAEETLKYLVEGAYVHRGIQ